VSVVAFGVGMLVAMRRPTDRQAGVPELAGVALVTAGAIALAGLQPKGVSPVPASAAVYAAVLRVPRRLGLPAAAAITAGLVVTMLATHSGGTGILASVLLCALMAIVAEFVLRAGESQDRAEVLYAQLQDARDAQAQAAAVAERGRIAADLHDVLAHSLSGAALQLQGARKLIERHGADPKIAAAVDRAAELVRGGLDDAKRAVSALHGQQQPALEQLPALIADFRQDQQADVAFSVLGRPRSLPADAGLALYRGAQEALTNIARYAPGASVDVTLHHGDACTTLTIEDHATTQAQAPAPAPALNGVGGGHGLSGMRERVERVGGEMDAGATGDGWRVQLVVPA
jgi:signal transduction histidine kinase